MFHRPRGSLSFYLGHKHTRRFNSANMRLFSTPKSIASPATVALTRMFPPRTASVAPFAGLRLFNIGHFCNLDTAKFKLGQKARN